MLFKLSLRNIRKSFKDYAIYFFTLILGVAIFYVFNAIESQTVLLNVKSSTYEVIKLMINMLSGVSVFVAFVLGFLIIYASRFLMRRRHKEFGIYLTLGMSKRKISSILFIETIVIGIISLIVGLLLGSVLSQLMSILVANMFEADMTKFEFVFSASAFKKTLIYFGVMYLIVMLFNTISVSKCKLIDLLKLSKKSEKIKLKNPILCVIIFIISACLLSYAYYLVTGGVDKLNDVNMIFVPIAIGCVSTFFIFWSLSGLLLKIVMSMKNIYYKGLNSFTLRQVSNKINTTVFSISIICIMLFITICIFSTALTLKNSMTNNLKTRAPVDIELTKNLDMGSEYLSPEWGFNERQLEDSKISIRETLEKNNFSVDENYKDVIEFNTYITKDITVKDTLGNEYAPIKKEMPYLDFEAEEEFIKLSDYNKVAKLYGLETFTLKDNEYIVVADFDQWVELRDMALLDNTPINLLGKTYYPKYKETKNGFIHISSNHINPGLFIVPDDAVDESIRGANVLIANYKADTEEGKEHIEDKLVNNVDEDSVVINASTKISIYDASIGLGALVTFIGLYLGIIFLISSAAILALKELTESTDNIERYRVLRKLGADEKLINKALFRQIFIFFIFPLIFAIIHSIFGIMFSNYILSTLGNEKLLSSIIMTAIFIVFIYGGYFVITYICSKNIIKEK